MPVARFSAVQAKYIGHWRREAEEHIEEIKP